MNADDAVSAIADGDGPVDLSGADRAAIAQRLFVHALLRERASRSSLEDVVAQSLARLRPRPWWRRVAAAAAVLVVPAALALLLLSDRALPAAEAVVDKIERALAQPVDRHYRIRSLSDDGSVRVRQIWFRADRWALSREGPLGTHWAGGNASSVWWVTPRGAVREFPDLPSLWRAMRESEADGAYATLARAMQDLRTGFELRTVAREGTLVRIQATATQTRTAIRSAVLVAEEETGVLRRAELVMDSRTHVLEMVDSDPQPDAHYQPAGHRNP
jgi:hypothetical protein